MNLLRLTDLGTADVRNIWELASRPPQAMTGTVGWSFEGNGIRTRTSFIQAIRDLGLAFTELPNLLKTNERPCDLAGYLDPFYSLYVLRDSNHARMAEFAAASGRPVVNAMSGEGHPCEVLTDARFIHKHIRPLDEARICLWGPPTNVFRSWHELAAVLGLSVTHVCDARFHEARSNVRFAQAPTRADVVITDGWPPGLDAPQWALTQEHLAEMGSPALLPTPPFAIGRELSFDPLAYAGFVGYQQKAMLVPMQRAILRYVLEH
jgi:ornithine carbamoyltransferase